MALSLIKRYTIEDINSLPEHKRAEIIEGQLYDMTPSGTNHQRISNYISTEINLYIRNKNGFWEVFSAQFSVFLDNLCRARYISFL